LATCGRRRLPQKWREKRALGVSQNAKSHFERFLVKSVQ
jgi:flagellar biosynthesis chaperone FliJ